MKHTHLELYGAIALTVLAVTVSVTAVSKSLFSERDTALVPTFTEDLMLYGQVSSSDMPLREYSSSEVSDGIVLEPGTHNFIEGCTTVGDSLVGDQTFSDTVRFWAYEFTGSEPPFNGAFFISDAQLAENPNLSALPQFTTMQPGKRYYVMTEESARFSCGNGISSLQMLSVRQDPLPGNQLTIADEPALLLRFTFTADRNMELDQLNLTQGYWDGNTIVPDNIVREFSVRANGNTHLPIDVYTNQFGDIEIDMGSAGSRINLPANTPTLVEVFADSIDPQYESLGIYVKEQNGIDVRGIDNPDDRANAANSSLDFSATQRITLDLTVPVVCGDGVVGGDEKCDGALNCTADCKPKEGYECNDNIECTPLIPSLDTVEEMSCSTMKGDIASERGVLNMTDFNVLMSVIEEDAPLDDERFACGDMNDDGTLTMDDAQMLFTLLNNNEEVEEEEEGEEEESDETVTCPKKNLGDVAAPYNSLTSSDVLVVMQIVDGTIASIDAERAACADFNQDGAITIRDAQAIQYEILNGNSAAPAEGALNVEEGSTPGPNQLLGGILSDVLLRFTLEADDATIGITEIHFEAASSLSSIDRLELFTESASQPFAYATADACDTGSDRSYCAVIADGSLDVAESTDADIVVRARMHNDSAGALSGEEIAFSLVEVNAANATVTMQENIATAVHTAVLAKIASISNANPNANGSPMPGGPTAIGMFSIAAEETLNRLNGVNDVGIDAIIFNVNASNAALAANAFYLYDKSDASATRKVQCDPYYLTGAPFSADNVSGSIAVLCDGSAIDFAIDSQSSRILVLEGNVVSMRVNPNAASTLQVSLSNLNDDTKSFGITGNHIRWTDADTGGGSVFDWIDYDTPTIKSTSYQG